MATGMHGSEIAIIGMAGCFPGASSPEVFWENLCQGVESIRRVPAEELLAHGAPPALLRDPNFIAAAAMPDDIELFDASFFNINPKDAEIMDPQSRLLLQYSWQALEQAGYINDDQNRVTGVYLGAGVNTYLLYHLLQNPEVAGSVDQLQINIGNASDFLSTRVSYKLNLKGPSITIQTACSTSLVAVHVACQGLLNEECDLALAGGAAINVKQRYGYRYTQGGIVSPDGHCRAFDAEARGTVFGSGVGVVVLKRLEDALADGDTILAVIKGSAINNDGSSKVGYTAPSVDGQAEVIAEALAAAGVDPETISYIEAHGTATPLGDPIEIAALTKAFRVSTPKTGFCAIGSVKTNIGHLDAAAGIAGLIKTVLAMQHRQLPPSLHLVRPNPQIEFATSPFYVNAMLRDWQTTQLPRRAGVSSFGIGGTNAHVILEEAPPVAPSAAPRHPAQLLLLSARTPSALASASANLAAHLAQHPELALADVAATLQLGRRAFRQRCALVVTDHAQAIAALRSADPQAFSATEALPQRPVVFLFPGQGAQYVGMGQDLYHSQPRFRAVVDQCAALLASQIGLDLRNLLYPSDDPAAAAAQLAETDLGQVALFVVSYALAQQWIAWGVQPAAMIGHSLGEYVAACLAGVFSLEAGLRLVVQRGKLMQAQPRGAMLAVSLPAAVLAPRLSPDLTVAVESSADSCVVAGPSEAIAALSTALTQEGVIHRSVPTTHAFHSALMDGAVAGLTAAATATPLAAPTIPYISTVSGTWITAAEATDARYWGRQLRAPVRLATGLATVASLAGAILLELGPGQTMSSLARRQRGSDQVVVASMRHRADTRDDVVVLLDALGQFWVAGGTVDWARFHTDQPRRRVPLPTYPFERQRYWIEPANSMAIYGEYLLNLNDQCPAPRIEQESGVAASESVEIQMAPTVLQQTSDEQRRAKIISKLEPIFQKTMGIDISRVAAGTSLFEMGVDSLILLQFNQHLNDTFGINLTIRQFFEELSTIDALIAYLTQHVVLDEPTVATPQIAPSAPQPPSITSPSGSGAAAQPPTTTAGMMPAPGAGLVASLAQQVVAQQAIQPALPAGAAGPESGLQQLMMMQLHIISQQLAIVSGAGTMPSAVPPHQVMTGVPVPAASPSNSVSTEAGPPAPTASPSNKLGAETAAWSSGNGRNGAEPPAPAAPSNATPRAKPEQEPFVPYKSLQMATTPMAPEQQQALTLLIDRYTKRTKGSKDLTQRYRAAWANNRNVAGFRPDLKELVYQITVERGDGAKIWDVDGNQFIDLTMGFGVYLFGHNAAFIQEAVQAELQRGTCVGPSSRMAGKVAELIADLTGVERVAFFNSGTEAVMVALRIARAVTKRAKIAIFAGSFHGTFDGILARAHTASEELRAVPLAPGITHHMVEDVIVLPYGNPQSLQAIERHAHELAAVLVEPVQSRRPDLQPREFLHELRRITEQAKVALIFDEVITGFRIHPGGAQAWFGVQADIVTYGKIVGGGMPIGVVAGKATFLDSIDGGMWSYGDASYPPHDEKRTFVAGTFCQHPLAMAASFAVLSRLKQEGSGLQERLNRQTAELTDRLNQYFQEQEVSIRMVRFGSLFRFVLQGDAELLYSYLLDKGIYIWEGRNCFLSTAHTEQDRQTIITAVQDSVAEMRRGGFLPRGVANTRPPLSRSTPNEESNGATDSSMRAPALRHPEAHAPVVAATQQRAAELAPPDQLTPTPPPGDKTIDFSLSYFGSYTSDFNHGKYDFLLQGAAFADAHDFAAIWVPERHFHDFGGFSPNPSVVAAALARETRRIKLRAGSVVAPLHHPVRIAEEWSVVDNLSGGRVGVSFASGWHANDFVLSPAIYAERRARMFADIDIVRRLWRGETLQFENGVGETIPIKIFPLPKQPELPIWVTAVRSPDTYRQAGALGAGILTNLMDQGLDELARNIALYRSALVEHGFAPDAGKVTVLLHTYLDADPTVARERARTPFLQYLKSFVGLAENLIRSQGMAIDPSKLGADDLDYLLSLAYERYCQQMALIGSPESCMPVIDNLISLGVDEIACFVDFGVAKEYALAGLEQLYRLKEEYRQRWATTAPAEAQQPIVAQLQQPEPLPSAAGDAQVVVDDRGMSIPLTEDQKQLWYTVKLRTDASVAYNEPILLKLEGQLDIAALHQAIRTVVQRHEALRSVIDSEGLNLRVAPELSLDLPIVDLTDLSPADRDTVIAQWLDAEGRRPFDLERGPLIRAYLVRPSASSYLLVCIVHHIIADDWSRGVILHEVAALYSAACQGQTIQLPQPTSFRAYSAWQRNLERDPKLDAAAAYWHQQLKHLSYPLELPTDYPRLPMKTYAGARQHIILDPSLAAALRQLSMRQNCTLFMVFLAAFKTLLYQLTGQRNLAVAIPATGQPLMGVMSLIGQCITMLPICTQADGRYTFTDYLTSIKKALLDVYSHQTYSFATLVQRSQLQGLGQSPVTVMFNMDRAIELPKFYGMQTEVLPYPISFVKFDLSFNVIEINGQFRLDLEYNTDLFAPATIQAWVAQIEAILRTIGQQPSVPLAQLPLAHLTQATPEAPIPHYGMPEAATSSLTVAQRFTAQVQARPHALALQFGEERYTYQELHHQVEEKAKLLRAYGVAPGQVVGVLLNQSIERITTILGILHVGAAYLLLDDSIADEQLAELIAQAIPTRLITRGARSQRYSFNGPVIDLDDTENPQHEQNLSTESMGDGHPTLPACVVYAHHPQHGLTLRTLSHLGVSARCQATQELLQLGPEDRVLLAPFSLLEPGIEKMLTTLLAGATLIIAPPAPMDLAELEQVLYASNITLLDLPISLAERLMQRMADTQRRLPHSITRVILGDGFPLTTHWQLFTQVATDAVALRCVFRPEGLPLIALSAEVRETKLPVSRIAPLSLRFPRSFTRMQILDADQRPVPIGAVGMLSIEVNELMWGCPMPAGVTSSIAQPLAVDGHERLELWGTDAYAWLGADGSLHLLGSRVNHSAEPIYRRELSLVEATLNQHPHVRESVVAAGSPETLIGQQGLTAYITSHSDQPPTPRTLEQYLRKRLPARLLPATFEIVRDLPLSRTGTHVHTAPVGSTSQITAQTEQPHNARTEEERTLAILWAEMLGLAHVDIFEQYWNLGGQSLLAVQLLTRINETFQIKLTLRDFLNAPTVAALAALIAQPRTGAAQLATSSPPLPADIAQHSNGLDQPARQSAGIAPVTKTEQLIAAILQEVLNIEQVSTQESFYELGICSIYLEPVHRRLEDAFKCSLPRSCLLLHPTIHALGVYLDQPAHGAAGPTGASHIVDMQDLEKRKNRLKEVARRRSQ